MTLLAQPPVAPGSASTQGTGCPGAVASPLAASIKKRRDPRSGLVYTLDKGQWLVDDAQTAEAAGRSAKLVEGVVRSDSGGAFGAVFSDNANATLIDRDEAARAFPQFHTARQADPGDFQHFATCTKQTKGFDWLPDGVQVVLGFKKDGQSEPQSYRFDRGKFSIAEAKAFLAKHHLSDKALEEAKNEGASGREGEGAKRSSPNHPLSHSPSHSSAVTRRAALNVNASTWRDSDRSIEAVICTDTPAWSTEVATGRAVKEVWLMSGLEFDPHVRLLNDHKREDVNNVLGSVADFQVAEHHTAARLFVSSAEEKIATKLREGHIRDVSVGGERKQIVTLPPGQTRNIQGETFTADPHEPLNIVTRMRVYEVSVTLIGADPNCVTRSHPSTERNAMKVTKFMRKFMTRSTGLNPQATDEEAQQHHDALHPDVQKACRAFADGEEKDEKDEDERKKTAAASEAARKQAADEEAARRSGATASADVIRRAAQEATAAERKRVADISEAGRGMSEDIVRKAIDDGLTVEAAKVSFFDAAKAGGNLAVQRNRTPAAGPFIQSRSLEKDLNVEVLSAAVVIRALNRIPADTQWDPVEQRMKTVAGPGGSFASRPEETLNRYQPQSLVMRGLGDYVGTHVNRSLTTAQRKHNEELVNRAERFSDLSTVDVCRHILRMEGIDPSDLSSPAIVSAALGTATGHVTRGDGGLSGGAFSAVFTNVFNATFTAAYLEASDTTMGWLSEDDGPDFKVGELANVEPMDQLALAGKAAAKNMTYGDWNEQIQISRFAGQYSIDEQDLINDRFGVLRTNSPQALGLSARRVRPNLVYSTLLGGYVASTSAAIGSMGPKLNQNGNALFCQANGNFLPSSTYTGTAVPATNDIYNPATGAVGTAGLQYLIPAIGSQRLNGAVLNLQPRFALITKYLDMAMRIAFFSTQRVVATGSGGTLNPLQTLGVEPRSDARLDAVGVQNPLANNAIVTGKNYGYILACRPGEEGSKTGVVRYLQGTGRAPQIRSGIMGPQSGTPGRYGLMWDVKLDVGFAPEDFRGLAYAEATS